MKRFAISFLMLGAACSNSAAAPDLKPTQGWARETVPGQTSAAVYLTVINNGTGPDQLVGASSNRAMHAMLHSTTTDDDVMRMRHLGGGLAIPSKTAVELSPGRTHIMLAGLKQPLRRGDEIALGLRFERSGEKQVTIKVLDPLAAGAREAR